MNTADFEIIERDLAEIEAMKNARLLKVLKAAKGELLALMLGARPNAATSQTVDKLQAIIEELT
jgi:transcriptional accessory protein Tex/SPT6